MPYLSLFTPTHDPRYLEDAYHSLRWQSYQDWEWVLVLHGVSVDQIAPSLRSDPRVRLIPGPAVQRNVGALKRFACQHCRGEAFIEFDHDDMLVPGETLQVVAAAFKGGAGFVHSDDAAFKGTRPFIYSESHGFKSYPVYVYGRRLLATRSPAISARTLCEVYYSPDHLRAWQRDVYWKAGGHDPELLLGDDHDLLCRTYLTGCRWQHTGGCHYLYRRHDNNTCVVDNPIVIRQQDKNRHRYAAALAKEWSRREGLAVLDMAELRTAGWTWERNLREGLAEPNSVGLLVCDDLIQHCPPELLPGFMNLAYEALADNGFLELTFPVGDAACSDHRQRSRHSLESFFPYCVDGLARRGPDVRCRFQYVQHEPHMPEALKIKVPVGGGDWRHLKLHLAALKGGNVGPRFI